MKNVKGYKFVINENYTEESHNEYIRWASKRIDEIDSLLSIRFKDTLSPEYIEQLIEEEQYLMADIDSFASSWMDKMYNL